MYYRIEIYKNYPRETVNDICQFLKSTLNYSHNILILLVRFSI